MRAPASARLAAGGRADRHKHEKAPAHASLHPGHGAAGYSLDGRPESPSRTPSETPAEGSPAVASGRIRCLSKNASFLLEMRFTAVAGTFQGPLKRSRKAGVMGSNPIVGLGKCCKSQLRS